MSKSSMPVSKAKTAYQLLDDVADLILEEPLRYDQRYWRLTASAWKMPDCGTVCCIGGWVDQLKADGQAENVEDFTVARGVGASARNILGLTAAQARELFNPDAAGDEPVEGQSVEHGFNGVRHIRKFQKKYAKQLKAKRV